MARVLIVDDSVIMRRNLKIFLTRLGHTIVGEAGDGAEAVAVYLETKPDLVTMDISMPNSNGIEATRQILEINSKALIIMVSALKQKKDIMEAMNAGAKYFILKPFSDAKIKEVVELVLSSKE